MRGVSLLEMLLVIALIAAAGVLAASVLGAGVDGLRLRTSGKQLAAELRQVRTRAIASGVPQQFELDPRTGQWSSTLGHRGTLPSQLRVAFTGARELRPRPGRGAIRFFRRRCLQRRAHRPGGAKGAMADRSGLDHRRSA